MRKSVIMMVAIVLMTPAVWTGTLAEVTMADEVVVADTALHLNGLGLRKKLGAKIYVVGLYLEKKTTSAEEALSTTGPKRFVVHYLTDRATDERIDAAWIKGFKTNSPDNYDILEDRVMTFVCSIGDMKAGDVIEFTMIPGEGTLVTLNGEENGIIEGDDFQLALLRVGLGDKPPSAALKAGLLGLR
jgi:hypothetical protein